MQIPSHKCGLLLVCFVGLLLCSVPARAQGRIIKGTVANENGEPLSGVQVKIMGIDVGREFTVKTDDKGQYLYMGIPAGQYRVVAHVEGYQPGFVQPVKPTMQTDTTVNFKLKPGPDQKLPFEMSPEELQKAREELEKAEKRKASSAEVKAIFDNGLLLAQEGKYAEAIEEFKKALEVDPDQAYVQANMADAYSRLDKNEEALAAYQKAISLNPNDAAMYTNMGVVLGKMGRSAESQEAFKKAAAMDPAAAAQNFYNLGATMVNSGRSAEAAEAFRQAIAADPNFAEAYYQLGMSLSGDQQTIPEAIKALQKYIEISKKPDQVEVAKQIISALGGK